MRYFRNCSLSPNNIFIFIILNSFVIHCRLLSVNEFFGDIILINGFVRISVNLYVKFEIEKSTNYETASGRKK